MKIAILANSLAYYDKENRWYDSEDLSPQEIYPSLVARQIRPNTVKVAALPWLTVRDALEIVKESEPGSLDAFILHIGIVECVRRVYPIPLRRTINRLPIPKARVWLNDLERILLRLPLRGDGWISPDSFGTTLSKLCNEIRTKFEPKLLILITINHVDETFEAKHPGTNRSIYAHNQEIIRLQEQGSASIVRADMLLDRNCFLADSVHLNREGHALLANLVYEIIRARFSREDF